MGGTVTAGNRRDRSGAVFAMTLPRAADLSGYEEEAAA
jgi:two-component system sensor histidine kinase KdpD